LQTLQEPRQYNETEDSHITHSLLISTKPNQANWQISKNVLLEKPATLKTIEAQELEDKSKKCNLKLSVCQTYNYSEPAIQFKNIQQEERIVWGYQ
jgi:hypothetical protein